MRILSAFLLTIVSLSLGCSIMDRNLFFRDSGVNVVSCPTNIELVVDGQSCLTPCSLSLYSDTNVVTVSYYGQSTDVSLSPSALNSPSVNGTIFVLNPYNLGKSSDNPSTVYFIRDSKTIVNACGTVNQTSWSAPEEHEDYYEDSDEEIKDMEPIIELPADPEKN